MICIIRRKGFIQQEQSWSHQQSAGECYPLSLSARKHLCGLAQQMISVERLRQGFIAHRRIRIAGALLGKGKIALYRAPR